MRELTERLHELCDAAPFSTSWYLDAGIVFKGERPLFVLTAYTDRVPAALADGTPGFAVAAQLIGRLARTSWHALGG